MVVIDTTGKIHGIANVEIWRGRFAACRFSNKTCALLVDGAPTGKFQRFEKTYQIFDGNFLLLPLNFWD